ncbi:MAG: acetyl-CoA carboxylase biotin carboxyl carrier protein [Acidobacteria bacterium]|jgi:acetyl-CoA carboxylase biotin carboxyl carrier protein|nr:acetyl-CoA carboxylase biotin carboxyl carrier protein [Acidobacteriota bacterium]
MKGMNMDVEKLLEWLKKYDLTELTVKDGKSQVTLKKEPHAASFPHQPLLGIDEPVVPPQGNPPEAETPLAVHEAAGLHEVKAPLVGTFYRAPAPDAEPFVEEGDRVEVNDKLCIVEAMKIMNEIESPVRGIVREICARNKTSVEFGQVLFRIEEQA